MFFILVSAGGASGKVLYNDTIDEGDGYQINDYVIDVAEVVPQHETVFINIYEGDSDDPRYEKLISVGSSFEFGLEGENVDITVISVYSSEIPRAKLAITITDDDIINSRTLGVVEGGHSEAELSTTPVLAINKVVDKSNMNVGDVVRVTVTVENTGDGDAFDVIFSDPPQEKFILVDDILGSPGKVDISIDDPVKKIYVYDMKATEAGTFSLNPTTAIFTNSIGESFPMASSNQPTVIVEGSADQVSASLEVEMELDSYTVDRNEDLHGTISIRNVGDAPASAVNINMIIPEGLEYKGDDPSIEIISGVPTVYLDSFGIQQEKEFSFKVKAKEVGTYTLSLENSYLYNDGINSRMQSASSDLMTNRIYVTKGKYDYLFEQPVYVYLVPLLIIGAIAGWIYHRHKQYKF
ncbi:MAG: DUF11 domain-containing protein [Methanosarcinaceae archaeon]|nr:DUF11 domain-containing protein [Methanosarcinaceae archaeon]